jgi:hypothetical protein
MKVVLMKGLLEGMIGEINWYAEEVINKSK